MFLTFNLDTPLTPFSLSDAGSGIIMLFSRPLVPVSLPLVSTDPDLCPDRSRLIHHSPSSDRPITDLRDVFMQQKTPCGHGSSRRLILRRPRTHPPHYGNQSEKYIPSRFRHPTSIELFLLPAFRLPPVHTGCYAVDPIPYLFPYWLSWVPYLAYESFIFALAIYKSFSLARDQPETPWLVYILLRDSIVFFGGIFSIVLVNCLVNALGRVCESFIFDPFAQLISDV